MNIWVIKAYSILFQMIRQLWSVKSLLTVNQDYVKNKTFINQAILSKHMQTNAYKQKQNNQWHPAPYENHNAGLVNM